jgi:hypothetical protein
MPLKTTDSTDKNTNMYYICSIYQMKCPFYVHIKSISSTKPNSSNTITSLAYDISGYGNFSLGIFAVYRY